MAFRWFDRFVNHTVQRSISLCRRQFGSRISSSPSGSRVIIPATTQVMIGESPLEGFFNYILMLPYFFSCVWSPSNIVGVYRGVHWLNLLEDS